jgi:hypothetical protein
VTRQRLRTLASAGIATSAALVLAVWANGDLAPLTPARAGAIALPDLSEEAPADAAALAATLERPLFSPARRPAPTPAAAESTDAASPASQLVAVAIGPDRSAAILRLTSGKTLVLLQGEQIDGWVLSEVAPHRVLLRSGSGQADLRLSGSRE